MNTPLVTVAVPSYNHERYITACVDSIVGQSYPAIEIIAIDDGSRDRSPVILAELAQRHGFQFISQPNAGTATTLNRALALAKGKYFCPMGSDDIMLPEKIRLQVTFMEQHPDVAFCCGNAEHIDADDNLLKPPSRRVHHGTMDFETFFGNTRAGVIAPSTMIRTEALREIGGYDPAIPLEDLATWLKLTHKGYQIGFLDDVILRYRKHPTNTSKNLRFMYECITASYAPYQSHPRYPDVVNRFWVSTFIAAAKRGDFELASELLHRISPRYYNRKFLRGVGHLLTARVKKLVTG
jgi:alpha-1,3-rhamnosyltransferase